MIRLGQVIVRTGVEASDSFVQSAASGQHQHRRGDAALTKAAAQLEPIQARQHHVDD